MNELYLMVAITERARARQFLALFAKYNAAVTLSALGAGTVKGRPFAIVMKTTKGKGVSFMENQAGWHGKAPNDEQAEAALGELGAVLAGLEAV